MPQHDRALPHCYRLRLQGRWQLLADGEDVGLGHREERLTALLGITGHSSRPHVAGMLWPESTEPRALASLRRAVLQVQHSCPGLLQADRVSIGLHTGVEVDIDDVRRAAAAAEDALAEGAAGLLLGQLVGEDLLPDWYDDWVLPERERLEQLRVKALERIARRALEAGDLQLAVDAARAASDVDPLLESASELAIRAHLSRGDPGSALREFDRCRDAVRQELGVPPSRTILELIEPALTESRIAKEHQTRHSREEPEVAPVPPPAPAPRAARSDRRVGGVPDVEAVLRAAAAAPAFRPPERPPARPRAPVVSAGRRGVVVRLVAVAVLILAVAIAVAGFGPLRAGGDQGASGDAGDLVGPGGSSVTLPRMQVIPADRMIRPSRMMVRLVDAAAGRAAFLVRTTAQPSLVRLEVRGDTGRSVVRKVLVRSSAGRRLELSGLRPGTYRWEATSSVASAVGGRLRIPEPPATVETNADTTIEAADAGTTSGPTAEPTTGSTATASPAPTPSSDAPQTHRTTRPEPTDQPKDPGTRPPIPVG